MVPSPFDAYLSAEETAEGKAIVALYGALPDWLPEPALRQIRQALGALRNASQSAEQIAAIVPKASSRKFIIPATALDVADFIKSVNYLAHVRWALSLDKGRALEELGGSLAAKTYRGLKRGKDEQASASAREREARNQVIRTRAAELREANTSLSPHAIATKIAAELGISAKQVSRILAE